MKVTKRKLRRIIREVKSQVLREMAGAGIEFEATFSWDDYNYSGAPGQERELVSLDADDLMEYGDDGAHGFALWWAANNLDGGMAVDDVEISPSENTSKKYRISKSKLDSRL